MHAGGGSSVVGGSNPIVAGIFFIYVSLEVSVCGVRLEAYPNHIPLCAGQFGVVLHNTQLYVAEGNVYLNINYDVTVILTRVYLDYSSSRVLSQWRKSWHTSLARVG